MQVEETSPPGKLRIGTLELEGPLVLAPLAGYTIPPFRLLCRRLGASLVFTEMISATGLVYGNRGTCSLLERAEGEDPVGAQLFGSKPEDLARAGRRIQEARFQVVDVNMGCPVPKVTRAGAGAALLKDPGRALEIVRALAESVELPVTVKLRSGWDADHIVAPDLAPRLVEAGAKALAVHGRTREQGYAGKADWGVIRACREALGGEVPLLGSGDLWTPSRCLEVLSRGDCDGLLLARGALSDPWLFRRTADLLAGRPPRPASREERYRGAGEILSWLVERKGPRRGTQAFRSFFCLLVKGLPGASKFRQAVFEAREPEEVDRILREAFLEVSPPGLPPGGSGGPPGDPPPGSP